MQIINILAGLIGACTFAMLVSGSFVFGVACVCRWMEWAPVNTTITINNIARGEDE